MTRVQDWPYSNYLEWIGQRTWNLKDEVFIRDRFPTPKAYQEFVVDNQNETQSLEYIVKYIWD